MTSTSTLKGKHAIVFGAGGSIGPAVAKEFAAEGAEVFLSGRTTSSVEAVASARPLPTARLPKRRTWSAVTP